MVFFIPTEYDCDKTCSVVVVHLSALCCPCGVQILEAVLMRVVVSPLLAEKGSASKKVFLCWCKLIFFKFLLFSEYWQQLVCSVRCCWSFGGVSEMFDVVHTLWTNQFCADYKWGFEKSSFLILLKISRLTNCVIALGYLTAWISVWIRGQTLCWVARTHSYKCFQPVCTFATAFSKRTMVASRVCICMRSYVCQPISLCVKQLQLKNQKLDLGNVVGMHTLNVPHGSTLFYARVQVAATAFKAVMNV